MGEPGYLVGVILEPQVMSFQPVSCITDIYAGAVRFLFT